MLARKKLTFMERIMDRFAPDPEIPFLEAVMDHTREPWGDKIYLYPKSDGKIEYYYLSEVREGLNKITFI